MIVSSEDVMSRRYQEVFEALHSQLMERRRTDPDFTVDDIRGFLRDAYVHQGNDWLGRGALFDATQAATIAAYEVVLADWLSELEQAEPPSPGACPPR